MEKMTDTKKEAKRYSCEQQANVKCQTMSSILKREDVHHANKKQTNMVKVNKMAPLT